MKRAVAAGALLLALTACGDPATNDTRGYTKAPLEDPALLVDGEEPTIMGRMNETNRPRPPLHLAVADAGDAAGGGEQDPVTLAPGVTQAQFDQGRELFTGQGGCQACHGPDARGTMLAPALNDAEWLNLSDPDVAALAELITTGVPEPREHPAPMPPMGGASLTPEQVQALAAYVASISQS